jgi:hypothetical protein
MSQCGSGKCGFKINICLLFLPLLALSLVACSVSELESFARENEQAPPVSAGQSPSGSPYAKTDILIPETIIKGGQRVMSGVAGAFSRLLVGSEDEIRFLNPVAIGGMGNTLYIVDSGVPVDINEKTYELSRHNLPSKNETTVFRYDLVTKKIQSIETISLQLQGVPSDIFVKQDGSFFITDPVGKKVLYFNDMGGLLNTYSDPANLSRPIAVWEDEISQEVYVADGTYSHILVFDQFG